jgi:formylglycine-generating enzyme required for sulfatase activity
VLGVTFWPQQSQQTVPSQVGQSIDNDNTKVALSPAPAVAPFDAAQAKQHQQAWADHLGVSVETTNSVGMKFAVIPAGEFMMGSPEDEPGRGDDENETPLHEVTLTQPFQMGTHEVTQEQYQKVMGTNPSKFKGPQNPVEQVIWNDAVEFCRKLSEQPEEKAAGYMYRLPTEAEWEYACRAGTTTTYSFGDDASKLAQYAWYDKNSGNTTHAAGQKKPNAWGFYDMHGNVWEWCQDWNGGYPNGAQTDPTGPKTGSIQVYRAGCCRAPAGLCGSATRRGRTPGAIADRGFRVVRCDATPPELQVTWNPDNTWKPGACVAHLATVRNGIITPLQSSVDLQPSTQLALQAYQGSSQLLLKSIQIVDDETGEVVFLRNADGLRLQDFKTRLIGGGSITEEPTGIRLLAGSNKYQGNAFLQLKQILPTLFTATMLIDKPSSKGWENAYLHENGAESFRTESDARSLDRQHSLVIRRTPTEITSIRDGQDTGYKKQSWKRTLSFLPRGDIQEGMKYFDIRGDKLRLREDTDVTAAQSDFPLTLRCKWSPVTETAYSITPASRLAGPIEYKAN